MYCIQCGVRLADTEKKCPLCNTVVYHPEITQPATMPLYPGRKMPETRSGRKAVSGMLIILFLIPLAIGFFSDMQRDGQIDWFGYVAGALGVGYVMFGLPVWFRKPNPVIFAPCTFATIIVYLLYINYATGGSWFWGFALPVTGALGAIVCAWVTLMRYVRGGRLYIFGGTTIALGAFLLLVEWLLTETFQLPFLGWSVYPLIVLTLLGGTMIYLAINTVAREVLERKLFF